VDPKTNSYNSIKIKNLPVLYEILDIITAYQVRKDDILVSKKCTTTSILLTILKHITKNGLYNTAASLWKFQSLSQSDVLFCECPVHFLGLTPAPQLNQRFEQS